MGVLGFMSSMVDIYEQDFEAVIYVLMYSIIQEARKSFYFGLLLHSGTYFLISSALLQNTSLISQNIWHFWTLHGKKKRPKDNWWLLTAFTEGAIPHLAIPAVDQLVPMTVIPSLCVIAFNTPLLIIWAVCLWDIQYCITAICVLGGVVIVFDVFSYAEVIPTNVVSTSLARTCVNIARRKLKTKRDRVESSYICNETDESLFNYSPLPPGAFIRLLKVAPSAREEVTLTLINVEIQNAPKYGAVSYRWGDSLITHHILIDGRGIGITKSVYNVLRVLSAVQSVRYLWIDSICIDQKNHLEKNHQLPLMGQIYSKAEVVLAYIEPQTEEFAQFTHHFIHKLVLNEIYHDFAFIQKSHSYLPFQTSWAEWKLLRLLAFNEYWTRMWMIQEFALGRKVTILYGSTVIPWNCLNLVISIQQWTTLAAELKVQVSNINEHDEFVTMTETRKLVQESRAEGVSTLASLPDLITEFRVFGATQSHDKIYGLLGLYPDDVTCNFQPDYKKNASEVYIDLMKLALLKRNLRIFSCVGMTYRTEKDDLPSWVINLANPPQHVNHRMYLRGYTAGGVSPPDFHIEDKTILTIRGHIVDIITACSEEMISLPQLDARHNNVKTIGWVVDKTRVCAFFIANARILSEAVPDPYPSTQQPRDAALWRTLMQDFNNEARTTPVEPSIVTEVSKILTAQQKAALEDVTQSTDVMDIWKRMPSTHFYSKEARSTASSFPYVALTQLFAVTSSGYMAIVPRGTMPGDMLCVFQGFPLPFILRADGDGYVIWGDAYAHGIMNGEALENEAVWLNIH